MSDLKKNTDQEIWRETIDDSYAPSIHVTEAGGIGINVGGSVVVRPVREWHALAAIVLPAMHAALDRCASFLESIDRDECLCGLHELHRRNVAKTVQDTLATIGGKP